MRGDDRPTGPEMYIPLPPETVFELLALPGRLELLALPGRLELLALPDVSPASQGVF